MNPQDETKSFRIARDPGATPGSRTRENPSIPRSESVRSGSENWGAANLEPSCTFSHLPEQIQTAYYQSFASGFQFAEVRRSAPAAIEKLGYGLGTIPLKVGYDPNPRFEGQEWR